MDANPFFARSLAKAAPSPEAPPVITTDDPSSEEASMDFVKSIGWLVFGVNSIFDIFTEVEILCDLIKESSSC
jgi:hypothetical protein